MSFRRALAIVSLASLVSVAAASPARAQDAISKDTAAAVKASFVADLNTLHRKFVGLAEAFPQDKYTWRPMEGVRSVSEVLVNGPDKIYFERAGRLHRADLRFSDNAAVMAAARNIAEYVNRRIDADHHSMDARLPDGSRVAVVLSPVSVGGTAVAIRKFQNRRYNAEELVRLGTLTAEVLTESGTPSWRGKISSSRVEPARARPPC